MRIDQPIRLNRGFWILYLVTLGPWLWFIVPAFSGYPLYVLASAILFFPFISALVAYVSFHFVYALLTDFSGQRAAFISFGLLMAGLLVGLALTTFFMDGIRYPRWLAAIAGILLEVVLSFGIAHRKARNGKNRT